MFNFYVEVLKMSLKTPTLPQETQRPVERPRKGLEVEKTEVRQPRPLWQERIQQEFGE